MMDDISLVILKLKLQKERNNFLTAIESGVFSDAKKVLLRIKDIEKKIRENLEPDEIKDSLSLSKYIAKLDKENTREFLKDADKETLERISKAAKEMEYFDVYEEIKAITSAITT